MKQCINSELTVLNRASKKIRFFKLVGTVLVGLCLISQSPALFAETFKMGILPVIDTLPLQVGVQEGYFEDVGLDMELVMFNSANERNTAMYSGQLNGMFGDILATLLLAKNGVPIRFMSISYEVDSEQRMFGLMLAPGMADKTNGGVSVAISKASIIEYLLEKMEKTPETSSYNFNPIEIKRMPLRLQMLLTDQINAALLPEPLATLAESKGAKQIVSDQALSMPLTILALHWDSMKLRRSFMQAYTKSVVMLNMNPEKYRDLMVRTCRIPKPLEKTFPMYEYPIPRMPTATEVNEVQDWMINKGLLTEQIPYPSLIPDPQSLI